MGLITSTNYQFIFSLQLCCIIKIYVFLMWELVCDISCGHEGCTKKSRKGGVCVTHGATQSNDYSSKSGTMNEERTKIINI